jgi:hypothetical protein
MPGDIADVDVVQPSASAIALARSSVATGVTGRFFSRYSGWNCVKCSGTSAPRLALIHLRARPRNSSSLSLSVGSHQVDDLRPFAHLAQRDQRLQHRLQTAFDHIAVVGLGEGLQVDFDGVHLPVGRLQRLLPMKPFETTRLRMPASWPASAVSIRNSLKTTARCR